jgi:hypothetical protein
MEFNHEMIISAGYTQLSDIYITGVGVVDRGKQRAIPSPRAESVILESQAWWCIRF